MDGNDLLEAKMIRGCFTYDEAASKYCQANLWMSIQ